MQQRFATLSKYKHHAITAGFILYACKYLSSLEKNKETLELDDILFLTAWIIMISLAYRYYGTPKLRDNILNSQTFLHLTAVAKIPPLRLIILDNYAFDTQELVDYAKNYPHRLGRNPHSNILFSIIAKNQLRGHPATCNGMLVMEHQIYLQNTLINDAIVKRVIQLLQAIDHSLNPPAPLAAEEEDENEEEIINSEDDSDWEADWAIAPEERPDPMAQADWVDNEADIFVPEECNIAVIEFQIYLNKLKQAQRDTLKNYLIEVHSTRGAMQCLEFCAALAGGNNVEPCVKTLQIYLWQFVVDFKPGMLEHIPRGVKQAAANAKLEIRNNYSVFKYPESSNSNCCLRLFKRFQRNNLQDLNQVELPRLGR